ncbi:hypothetical protein K523DRAFT_422274, partial [Schizophyllum commune Tattone D]
MIFPSTCACTINSGIIRQDLNILPQIACALWDHGDSAVGQQHWLPFAFARFVPCYAHLQPLSPCASMLARRAARAASACRVR